MQDLVYCGPNISISNPLFKTARSNYKEKADYDCIDLSLIPKEYVQRSIYDVDMEQLKSYAAKTPWGSLYSNEYRLVARKMLGLNQERTLMAAIIPPSITHTDGLFGLAFKNVKDLLLAAGYYSSAGQKFYRTITDDTIPGGPVERTIEYVAPFDCCDREKDYETAWKFFEEKYGVQE